MNSALKYLTVLVIIMSLITAAPTRPTRSKLHFCRLYIYAPKCRGVQAKRDIRKLEPLLEEPRFTQENYDDYRGANNKQWQENDLSNARLLDTLARKINPRNVDYDTGTDDYMQ